MPDTNESPDHQNEAQGERGEHGERGDRGECGERGERAEREQRDNHRHANQQGPSPDVERRQPDEPTDLPPHSWWLVLRGTVREFRRDELPDRAAALTYYGVLSLFPALLVLVSLLGAAGEATTRQMLDNLRDLAPGPVHQLITDGLEQVRGGTGTGSALAFVGLAGALWTASGYIAAFIRSANAVYDIDEGRPVWKLTPLRLGLTLLLMVLSCAGAVIVVVSGGIARRTGEILGAGETAVTVWGIAKWPVLVVLVTGMVTMLYRFSPNARVQLRWLSPGGMLAIALWLAASAGFALYVANFGSYNKTYGTLAGVIVFLVWLWVANLAILLGLEFDAELARRRAIAGGLPRDAEPYVRPKDTRTWEGEA